MTFGQAYFVAILVTWLILNLSFIILLARKFKKKSKQVPESLAVFTVVVALFSTVGMIVAFSTYRINAAKIFHKEHAICIEKVKTIPLESHWADPLQAYFVLDESIDNHLVEDFYYDEHERFDAGDELMADGLYVRRREDVKFHPDSLVNDSIVMYKYHYKEWHGFKCPSVVQKVTFSAGDWEPFKRGICKTEIELK